MQKTKNNSNLVWFRNDLRTIDNAVLFEAQKNANNLLLSIVLIRHFL